jgi:hypothetical protein
MSIAKACHRCTLGAGTRAHRRRLELNQIKKLTCEANPTCDREVA